MIKPVIKLRTEDESQGVIMSIYCKGCNSSHEIYISGGGAETFQWNKSSSMPTIRPSVNVTSNQDPDYLCNFLLTEGVIKYSDNSTHAYKSQEVVLQEVRV